MGLGSGLLKLTDFEGEVTMLDFLGDVKYLDLWVSSGMEESKIESSDSVLSFLARSSLSSLKPENKKNLIKEMTLHNWLHKNVMKSKPALKLTCEIDAWRR